MALDQVDRTVVTQERTPLAGQPPVRCVTTVCITTFSPARQANE